MKAARFYAAGDIRVEDVDPPQATNDKVLVEVEWCGICGSDLNEYVRGPYAIPDEKKGPHHLTGEMLPVTLGHEFSGRVVQAPPTSSLVPGQPVAIDPRHVGSLGLSGGGGGLSEMVSVHPAMLHPLPNGTDLAAAALIEPLAVAWRAVKRSGLSNLKNAPVLVIGAGPIGVATVFVLKAEGCDMILVSEKAARRREFLADIVHAAFDPTEVNIVEKCRELTGGAGVEIVIDCAGAQSGFEHGCDSLRVHGTYVNLAIPKAPATLPFEHFLLKELTFKTFLAYDETDFKEVVAAFGSGRFAGVERMITRRISLDEIVEKGFKELTEKPGDHIKIIASPKIGLL
ncbi:chlorophyll synthesis pathway protein BchC [Paracoccidioides lutzii Pb01]|uniref:Chlorophyll synthesis pathway protein BchC n=1 Tax=Paracoccidioides lutzii (strain ATCC MYA-826 / Pb01) TaxID=502779 RepID=A0A0A2V347_PARBA|nr:chlorophyll synthesis pathway protein BchC [Paracoccidioides lutzii Pb01]KGQ00797.1 chlorophyll synthesis pathway protein BchC [Paracoccidioides lutzii Pb01]